MLSGVTAEILSLVYEILKSIHADFSFKEGKNIFEISTAIIEFFTGKSANDLIAAFRSSSPFDGITAQRNLHELINEFLSELLKERGNRLVVFVDELDRCKPDYAVRLLERVKHYFSNDHIVFVFSILLKTWVSFLSAIWYHSDTGTRKLKQGAKPAWQKYLSSRMTTRSAISSV